MRGNHPLDLSDGTKETSKALGPRTHFTGDAPTTEFERHRQGSCVLLSWGADAVASTTGHNRGDLSTHSDRQMGGFRAKNIKLRKSYPRAREQTILGLRYIP